MLVQQVVGWKLRMKFKEGSKKETRYKWTNTLGDVSNASPSPNHGKLDAVVDRKYRGRRLGF